MSKPNAPEDLKPVNVHESNSCGSFEIVHYATYKCIYIQFTRTGFVKKTTGKHIRNASVRDPFFPSIFGIGFIGVRDYATKINREKQKSYQTWYGMFERCYSRKYHERFPSYTECTVRSDWHNYQSFAKWFDEHYPKNEDPLNRAELDKDIKIEGNKEYSEEACMFVTRRENTIKAMAKSYSFTSPSGDRIDLYNLSYFCRRNGLMNCKMSAVNNGKRKSHKGWTKYSK